MRIIMLAAAMTALVLVSGSDLSSAAVTPVASNVGALANYNTASTSVAPLARIVVLKVSNLGKSGARAIIVRRPAGSTTSHDFILVDKHTVANDLAKAVSTLMYSYRTQGMNPPRELRAEISAAPASPVRPSDSERAVKHMARLSRAAVATIPGIGRGPAIAITARTVPPKRPK
jgi:hypothetical protein